MSRRATRKEKDRGERNRNIGQRNQNIQMKRDQEIVVANGKQANFKRSKHGIFHFFLRCSLSSPLSVLPFFLRLCRVPYLFTNFEFLRPPVYNLPLKAFHESVRRHNDGTSGQTVFALTKRIEIGTSDVGLT